MRIINKTKSTVIAQKSAIADTIWSRLVGLLGRSGLGRGEGLIITDCRSIHMFFMQFPIDAIFLDRTRSIVGLVRGIKPFRMSPYFFKAYYVIELPVGVIAESQSCLGDKIDWEN